MKNNRIPIYILTGFLGSGKTTLLLRLLEACKSQNINPGLVLNELGEVNVESGLFENQQMIELLNGCICCNIQEDLTKELSQFIQGMAGEAKEKIDLLLIEGTGVANPLEIVEALTHHSLVDHIEVKSIISLVDASRFLDYQSMFSSSKEIRTILKDQIIHSSLILLNKVDLLPSKKLEKVRTKMDQINTNKVEIIETVFGEVDIEAILQARMNTFSLSMGQNKHDQHVHEDGHSHEHKHENEHHHHHYHSHHLFQTLKIDDLPKLDRVKLEKWFNSLPESVLRAKGIIQLRETPGWYQFQFSSNQLILNRGANPEIDACIIIIGFNLPIEDIRESFRDISSRYEN
jgi:G3E family GTPase